MELKEATVMVVDDKPMLLEAERVMIVLWPVMANPCV
jgi:hypothetical protein